MSSGSIRRVTPPPKALSSSFRPGRLLIALVVALGAGYAVAQAAGVVPEAFDAKAYWLASQSDPYARSTVGQGYAYLYSPAFIQAFAPFQLLPWPAFTAAWTILMVLALAWTAGPWALPLLAILPVFSAITIGNIEFFLAAAVVAGFRYPASWAFVLLTKASMGVGLVWFAVRREWRSLAIALGATAGVAAISVALAPALWSQWLEVLTRNQTPVVTIWTLPGPLWLRMVVGAAIVVVGARTSRPWTVPIGASIALPVAWGSLWAIMIVGIVGVLRRTDGSILWRLERRETRTSAADTGGQAVSKVVAA